MASPASIHKMLASSCNTPVQERNSPRRPPEQATFESGLCLSSLPAFPPPPQLVPAFPCLPPHGSHCPQCLNPPRLERRIQTLDSSLAV